MQAFIQESQAQIAELCRAHHVRRLAVFGSAVRDDFDPARSDVDLLVEFEPDLAQNRFESYFHLHEALERILRRKVDLIEAGSVKNPYIQRAVERDQRALYAA
jgi:predicted nucleotidyltransferase